MQMKFMSLFNKVQISIEDIKVECMEIVTFSGAENCSWLIFYTVNIQSRGDEIFLGVGRGIIIVNTKKK